MRPHNTLSRVCPQCGGSKGKQSAMCIDCRRPTRHTCYVCPRCNGKKSHSVKLCLDCRREVDAIAYAKMHTCPQCSGWKERKGKTCRNCFTANPLTTKVCPQCGGPKERGSTICLSCYAPHGRKDPEHLPDGSTRLPLPHGEFTLIDTEDFESVKSYNWHQSGAGYVMAVIPELPGQSQTLLHRFLLNADPESIVDHRDRDRLNNRKSNLHAGTQSENMHNMGPRKGKAVRGVTLRKDTGRYSAHITCQRQQYALGCYDTEQEAAEAYDIAALRLFGERAVLNVQYRAGLNDAAQPNVPAPPATGVASNTDLGERVRRV